jgi:hypothetical protein
VGELCPIIHSRNIILDFLAMSKLLPNPHHATAPTASEMPTIPLVQIGNDTQTGALRTSSLTSLVPQLDRRDTPRLTSPIRPHSTMRSIPQSASTPPRSSSLLGASVDMTTITSIPISSAIPSTSVAVGAISPVDANLGHFLSPTTLPLTLPPLSSRASVVLPATPTVDVRVPPTVKAVQKIGETVHATSVSFSFPTTSDRPPATSRVQFTYSSTPTRQASDADQSVYPAPAPMQTIYRSIRETFVRLLTLYFSN